MTELRRGRSWSSLIPNVLFVLQLGIAMSAGAASGGSTAAQAIPIASANLIVNPDFDRGVAGWAPQWFTLVDADAKSRGWAASATWAPDRDFGGRPDSGSLELAITAAEGRCVWVRQCVVAHPGTYELTGQVLVHATDVHTRGAMVNLQVFWAGSSECESAAMSHTWWYVDATAAATGRWTPIVDPTTFTLGRDEVNFNEYGRQAGRVGLISVPEGTRGALLELSACVSGYSKSPETVVADFDHLSLRALGKGKPAPVLNSSSHP